MIFTPDKVRETIEHVGTGIAPKDDWIPVLLWESKGAASVIGMPMDMATDLDRDIVAGVIVRTLREMEAESAVWIVTAWSLRLDEKASQAEKDEAMAQACAHEIHKRPDKIEVVSATIAHRHCDKIIQILGRVIRSETKHPRVRWEMEGMEKADSISGRFPEALQEGLNTWR